MMGRFSEKRILITGGSGGMGLAGAKRIASEGGQVMVTGLNPAHLHEAAAQLPAGAVVLQNDAANAAAAGAHLSQFLDIRCPPSQTCCC